MEILELKPLRNKKVKLYLIRSEDKDFTNEDYRNLREILENELFRFAVIDLNRKNLKEIYEEPLFRFLEKFKIPYYSVDIPENVKDYLYVEILEKEVQINDLEKEYSLLSVNPEQQNSFKAQNLKSWIELLKKEVENKKKYLKLTVKPQWIVKQVLDIANRINNNEFSIMHFTYGELYSELKKLFKEYNIKVIKIDIEKKNIKSILIENRR